MCKDYRVRFSCPSSYCTEKVCWTEWFDRDNPSGTGDWELLSDLRRENPGQICETPQYIQAKADSVLGVFKRDKFYIYNPTKGFVCRNEDQKFTDCWDYKPSSSTLGPQAPPLIAADLLDERGCPLHTDLAKCAFGFVHCHLLPPRRPPGPHTGSSRLLKRMVSNFSCSLQQQQLLLDLLL
ncbi:Cartilage intermediate layer protein 2 [Oryzias melastigma]|uniref:Cartilage intermediate layer protein 2 n=1 Tax=Oryzias melastigma TaxID=30732 RepID=A0A834FFJ6_ORYME|nr:Cartilage intermediate layer protein 2 [Oryzias melastigma]